MPETRKVIVEKINVATQDTGAPGILIIPDEDGGILVKTDIAAVGTVDA